MPRDFWRHCEVAEVLFALGADPDTNHHIREAIREASEKVGQICTNDTKHLAEYMSEAAEAEMLNGRFANLTVEHIRAPHCLHNSRAV